MPASVPVLSDLTVTVTYVCLCPGLTVRMAVTFFVVLGGGLTVRERLFVTLAWLPKATVQVSAGRGGSSGHPGQSVPGEWEVSPVMGILSVLIAEL